jgi:putative membrane protein
VSGSERDPISFEVVKPGRSAPDEHGRRRVHPWTPFIEGVRWWPGGVVAGFTLASQAQVEVGTGAVLVGLAGLVGVTLLGMAWGYLGWQRRTFWFDEDGDLRVDSGVVSRNERRVQLSRLQSVDVLQPLIARFAGLAEVRVEVAGAGDSKINLQFLTLREANELRNEIIARSAGVRHDVAEAPENVLVTVPPGDLVVSLLLRAETWLLLAVSILLLVTTLLTNGVAGIGFLIVGGIPVFQVFTQFSRYYDFTVAESPDGLRLRHGLLQKTRQTVPPGRVQAVGFVQPFLWRKRGWVRVRLNVAGASSSTQGSGNETYTENVLLPVAPWPVALAIVARVLPGVDLQSIPTIPAPERSRRRAWIQWRQLAVGWDDQVFITRGGRITERWDVVPHARTQSVRVTQGPWQRSLGLASMHVDSTPGSVKITGHHRDADEARRLAQEQADRASVARAGDRSLRWVAQQQLAGQQPDAATPSAAPQDGGILGPQASEVADLGPTASAVEPDPGERPEA